MPVITLITQQKRRANRRSVHLDGQFAFGCNVNVVARFRLREGMPLTEEQVRQIEQGEVRQDCFDSAMRLLESRLHSTAELRRKLMRKEHGVAVLASVIEQLTQLGYLNDERFARAKAQSAAEHKQHGKRRAKIELLKAGVKGEIAEKALSDVYDAADTLATARALAEKMAPRLRKLDPLTARRRLVGMLQRRGFDYDDIRPIVQEFLAGTDTEEEST